MGWIASRFRRRRPAVVAEPSSHERPPEPPKREPSQPAAAPPRVAERHHAPREWNLWDLERIARERAGDAARNEERAYLLMYLREFATADGILPADFDALVRESFADVLDPAYS